MASTGYTYAITNQVANLEELETNQDFHPMVKFFKASSVNYALTATPLLFTEPIEEAWKTATIIQNQGQADRLQITIHGETKDITSEVINSALHLGAGPFDNLPSDDELVSMLNFIGYTDSITHLGKITRKHLRKEWSYFFDCLTKVFSAKAGGYDAITLFIQKIGYGLIFNKNIDIGSLILNELIEKIKSSKTVIYYPRFLMILINHLYKNLSIANRSAIVKAALVHKRIFNSIKNPSGVRALVLPQHMQVLSSAPTSSIPVISSSQTGAMEGGSSDPNLPTQAPTSKSKRKHTQKVTKKPSASFEGEKGSVEGEQGRAIEQSQAQLATTVTQTTQPQMSEEVRNKESGSSQLGTFQRKHKRRKLILRYDSDSEATLIDESLHSIPEIQPHSTSILDSPSHPIEHISPKEATSDMIPLDPLSIDSQHVPSVEKLPLQSEDVQPQEPSTPKVDALISSDDVHEGSSPLPETHSVFAGHSSGAHDEVPTAMEVEIHQPQSPPQLPLVSSDAPFHPVSSDTPAPTTLSSEDHTAHRNPGTILSEDVEKCVESLATGQEEGEICEDTLVGVQNESLVLENQEIGEDVSKDEILGETAEPTFEQVFEAAVRQPTGSSSDADSVPLTYTNQTFPSYGAHLRALTDLSDADFETISLIKKIDDDRVASKLRREDEAADDEEPVNDDTWLDANRTNTLADATSLIRQLYLTSLGSNASTLSPPDVYEALNNQLKCLLKVNHHLAVGLIDSLDRMKTDYDLKLTSHERFITSLLPHNTMHDLNLKLKKEVPTASRLEELDTRMASIESAQATLASTQCTIVSALRKIHPSAFPDDVKKGEKETAAQLQNRFDNAETKAEKKAIAQKMIALLDEMSARNQQLNESISASRQALASASEQAPASASASEQAPASEREKGEVTIVETSLTPIDLTPQPKQANVKGKEALNAEEMRELAKLKKSRTSSLASSGSEVRGERLMASAFASAQDQMVEVELDGETVWVHRSDKDTIEKATQQKILKIQAEDAKVEAEANQQTEEEMEKKRISGGQQKKSRGQKAADTRKRNREMERLEKLKTEKQLVRNTPLETPLEAIPLRAIPLVEAETQATPEVSAQVTMAAPSETADKSTEKRRIKADLKIGVDNALLTVEDQKYILILYKDGEAKRYPLPALEELKLEDLRWIVQHLSQETSSQLRIQIEDVLKKVEDESEKLPRLVKDPYGLVFRDNDGSKKFFNYHKNIGKLSKQSLELILSKIAHVDDQEMNQFRALLKKKLNDKKLGEKLTSPADPLD